MYECNSYDFFGPVPYALYPIPSLMIASLTGTIVRKDDRGLIVDVAGVGYKVDVSFASLAALGKPGEKITVLTSMHFSDRDGFVLYGFSEERERTLFLFLIEVPGVGPKGALTILSAASAAELEEAIAAGDEQLLTRVSGIGKKKAQKILIELKDRYEGLAIAGAGSDTVDVLDALVALGISEGEARRVVRELPKELKSPEEKIRAALKQLGS